MATILDCPMAAVNVEDTLWVGLLSRSTGDAVSHFAGALATFFIEELPFDGEGLSDVGKVQVAVEFRGGPDLSGFDSPMIRGRRLNEIGFLAILKP